MKLPTPGDMKSTFISVLTALLLLNMLSVGGTRIIRVLLGKGWTAFKVFAPILLPLVIGIGITIVLKLGVAAWRAWSWKWRR